MIGLGGRDSFSNYMVFLCVLFVFASLMNQQMAMFASFASESKLQVFSAVTLFFFILFSGFIVPVATIPPYYEIFYWLNPFAWAYNALVVNEVYSGRWDNPEAILEANGFVDPDGNVYDTSWIRWSFVYLIAYWGLCTIGTALGFGFGRSAESISSSPKSAIEISEQHDEEESNRIEIPFKPTTLSFQNLCYEVTASTTQEKLMLLKNINGVFSPGRMCALMGTSGAG